MDKTITLQGKTAAEQAVIKASKLAEVELYDFKLDGYDVELSDIHEANGLLTITVKALKDGKELVLDNPFQYHNPPIMVHDGTFRKGKHPMGEKDIQIPNYVENPKQALKEIIINTIKAVVK